MVKDREGKPGKRLEWGRTLTRVEKSKPWKEKQYRSGRSKHQGELIDAKQARTWNLRSRLREIVIEERCGSSSIAGERNLQIGGWGKRAREKGKGTASESNLIKEKQDGKGVSRYE